MKNSECGIRNAEFGVSGLQSKLRKATLGRIDELFTDLVVAQDSILVSIRSYSTQEFAVWSQVRNRRLRARFPEFVNRA